jgi:hypothetical protein
MPDNANARAAAARGFVRSLNILLKFARMYDFGHPRTAKQYETAWTELKTALGQDDEAGLLLAVSGDSLLLDGTPLESGSAEKSFARMLSTAGIASIHFSPKITQSSLARFVRGFPTSSSAKAAQLADQLKAALQGDPHIHVNEVCFVPADSAVAKTTVAAQIAARTLGMNSDQTDQLLNDPEKLLQLLVAAEGSRSGGSGKGPGLGPGNGPGDGPGNGPGTGSGEGQGGGSGRGAGSGSGSGASVYAGSASSLEGAAGMVGVGGGTVGSGGWNIVGGTGSGGGTPIDSNVGGFWFSKDGETAKTPVSAGPGGASQPGAGSNAPASSGPKVDGPMAPQGGGWNIVGGSGGGTPIDSNVGGFWLSKDEPKAPATSTVAGGTGAAPGGVASGASGSTGTATAESAYSGASTPTGRFPGRAESGGGPASRWTSASSGIRTHRSARGGAGAMSVETGLMTLQEDELQGIMQVLAQIARTSESSKDRIDPSSFQSRLSTLPRRARFTVSQALSALAAQAPASGSDKPTLLKLAEHIAVRFALESYEKGDTKVNAVRQMLDEMNTELDSLRKVLGVYEEKMAKAGIHIQSPAELLAQEFWSQVSEEKKKLVLESSEAWCVPPQRLREYIDKLNERNDSETVDKILTNYANCIKSKEPEARRQSALGLAELAGFYAKGSEKLFGDTVRLVGEQLTEEKDSQLQSLMGAAFVRLSQEAAKLKNYGVLQSSVEFLDKLDKERPGAGKSLRPRIAVENRVPEYIDEALKSGTVPTGLSDLLRRMPEAAAEQIAGRFSRVGFREDCELLMKMLEGLGPDGLEHLRKQLKQGRPSEAIDTIGILARLDLETVERVLPERIRDWKRTAHDRIVRQLAASGSPERGRLLLQLFDAIDSLIQPLAVDEIGMSGEKGADMRLLRIAEGDLPRGSTEYLRLKAIEALGRLRTAGAEAILKRVAEARKTFRWANPSELRVVAAQALEKIDPEWMRDFVPRSGLSIAEFSIELLDSDPNSSAIRQRRYPRLRLERPVPATAILSKDNCKVDISEMGLGGGVAVCEQSLHPGNVIELRLNTSQKAIRAQTIVRDANTQARAFEVVDMDIEERAKLRRLLVALGSLQRQSTPNERNRHAGRTISVTNS